MAEMLFLAHRIPFPPDRGDKIRSWNMLKHLGTLGKVHLACFGDDAADAAHLNALREAMGGSLGEAHVEVRRTGRAVGGARALLSGKPVSLTMFDSRAMHAFVADVLARPEVGSVFVFSGQMAQFVPKHARQRFVMDFGDMDSAKFADYADKGGLLAPLHRREAARLFAFERATAARADVSLFVTAAEAGLFRRRADLPGADIRAVANGVDLAFYDPRVDFPRPSGQGPLIVFTGQMDYAPNVDAVTWFADQVLPRIVGSARFAIVGRKPTAAVQALAARDRITVTGAVDDIRTWLTAASVVVAPLRIARGVQNKVLEAMAMALPVIASPPAYEGIDALPGRDLLVADTPEEWANAVQGLLDDHSGAAGMGRAARHRVEQVYRWQASLAPMAAILGIGPAPAAVAA